MYRLPVYTALFVALLLGAAAVWMGDQAWDRYQKGSPQEVRLASEGAQKEPGSLPLQELLQRLSLPESSRLLEIEVVQHNGVALYEIDLVTPEGAVKELLVDPRSGHVMKGRELDEKGE